MSVSMYQASVPVMTRFLENLSAILKKAEAHAEAKKIDPSVFVQARLYPDMFPLVKQVQIACDVSKGCAGRLAGVEIPSHADTETSFAELQARIEKTIAFIKSVPQGAIDGTEGKDIALKIGTYELQFTGLSYLLNFALPNLFFHVSTTYGILRHGGVELGKADFLGPV